MMKKQKNQFKNWHSSRHDLVIIIIYARAREHARLE